MSNPDTTYAGLKLQRKPHTGDRVRWPHGTTGIVTRVYDNGICWFMPDGSDKESSFIWQFTEGLNKDVEIVE